MAHGWNSFLQSLSSDTSTLRVPLDTEENLAQHIESLIEHNDLSNLVDSQEAPSPETSLNSNFYSDPSTNSDLVQQKYYNDLPWPEEGGQQAIQQDCDMLNPSFLEEYSDVSSSSKSDVDDIKPFCDELNNESHKLSNQEIGNSKNASLKEGLYTGESSESGWAERLSALECEQKEDLHGAQEMDGEKETCIQEYQPSSASYSPCSLVSEKGDQPSSASYSPSSLESENDCVDEKELDEVEEKELEEVEEKELEEEEEKELEEEEVKELEEEEVKELEEEEVKELEEEEEKELEEEEEKEPEEVKELEEEEEEEEEEKELEEEEEKELEEEEEKELEEEEEKELEEEEEKELEEEDEKELEEVEEKEPEEVEDKKESRLKDELPDTLSAPSGYTCASECGREEDLNDASQDCEQEENDGMAKREETRVQADHTFSFAIKNLSASESEKDADMLDNTQEREQQEQDCKNKSMQEEPVSDSVSETSECRSVSQSEVDDKQEQRAEDQIWVRQDLHPETKRDSNGSEPMDQQLACSKPDDPYSDVSLNSHNEDSIMGECQVNEYAPSSTLEHVDSQAIKISDEQDSAKKCNDSKKNICYNSLEHSLGACNSAPQSQPEHEGISPIEETDTSSHLKEHQHQTMQEHYTYHTEPPDLFRADVENARGPFQEEHLPDDGQEPPFLSECYGEPLSGDDSISEPESKRGAKSESCHDESEYIAVVNTEPTNDLKDLAPKLKSSLEMSKCLHPIVLLKTLEVRNNTEAFHCAECKHATLNVDHVIEHHHSKHSQYKFQFCQTCDTYLTSNELAEMCGVCDATHPVTLNTTPQGRKLATPVTYNCRYCSKTFTGRKALINHSRGHRLGINRRSTPTPYKCHKCGNYFAQSGNLNKHKRLVNCRPSSSQLATEKLVDQDVGSINKMQAVKPHVLPNDSPNDNLPDCFVKLIDICKNNFCHPCMKSFPTRIKLKKHEYNVHRNTFEMPFTKVEKQESVPNETEQKSDPEETEKSDKYKCPLCFRIFKYSYNRARHMREQCIQNFTCGDKGRVGKKFKCPLCYATFNHASNRRRHIKMTCMREYNTKQFRTRSNSLRTTSEHKEDVQQTERQRSPLMTPHHNEPYKCKLCPAVYAHYSGLYRHVKKHKLFNITGKVVKYRRSFIAEQSKDNDASQNALPLKEDQSPPISCHFCGKCFNNTYSLKKHMRKHRGGKPYRCLECGKGFRKQTYLLAHKKVHQRRIQCTVCKKIVPTITELIQHRQSHIKKGVLQCPDCPMQFQYPIYLLRHMSSHHKGTQPDHAKPHQAKPEKAKQESVPRNCPICKGVFESGKALRIHCLKHSASTSRDCPFCKRRFTQRQSMIRHMYLHTGEKPYSCEICKKGFRRKVSVKNHLKKCPGPQAKPAVAVSKGPQAKPAVTVSKGPQAKPAVTVSKGPQAKPAVTMSKGPQAKPALLSIIKDNKGRKKYKCSFCPREFERVDRFNTHHISHKMNSLLPCSKCCSFFGKNKFKRHEENCNTILHPCRGCGKCFSRKCNQIIHERTCKSTSLSQLSSVRNGTQSKDKLPFKCPHCPSMFRYRSYLLRHLQTHNREQFSCMHCGHRYTNQYRYLQHEAFCDGVKKQGSSGVTTKTSSPLSSFKEAKRQSQGDVEGEYRCKFCTKTFMKSRYLRRHILTHNEVKPYRCKTCDSCFSRHDHLKLHQTRCKGKRRRLEVCIAKVSLDDIGRGWQNKLSMLNKGQLNEFDCSSCSRRFSSQTNLARHFSLQHATSKPFRCTKCGNSFTQEKSLRRHKKLNTCRMASTKTLPQRFNSVKESPIIRELPRRETNGLLQRNQLPFKSRLRYSCKYCPRAFKGCEALKVHLRLHTGEKPFGCADCGERFIRRDYLKRHLIKCNSREHQDTALCERCGGVFSPDKLRDHQKTCTIKSTAPRPNSCESTQRTPPRGFSCANCSSRFLLFSQLQQHFLNTHRQEPSLQSTNQTQTLPLHQQLSNMMSIKEEPLDDGFGDTNQSINYDLEDTEDVDSGEGMAKPFSCPQCKMRFVNKGGLSMHMHVHSGKLPFNCKKCRKGFWNRNPYRKHIGRCNKLENMIKVEHSADIEMASEIGSTLNDTVLVFNQGSQTTGTGVLQTNFSCKDDLNATQDDLTRNQRKGSSSDKNKVVQYQCSECDQSFTDGLMLISHLEDHGREEQQQKLSICQRCGKKCSSPGNLERHMRVHANEKTYSCPECSKNFYSSTDFDIHRTCHDPNRPFACKECKHRFWSNQSLGKHYSQAHSTDAYICKFCNKSYKMRGSLARHCRMRHQTQLSDEADGPTKEKETTGQGIGINVNETKDTSDADETSNEDEKDGSEDNDSDSAPYFPCHVCGKTFLTSESLEDHQRCHLGEKPHECAECGKCFFQAAQLQQHQRSHKSEFQCQTCGRGFVSLFALRKHKHTHGKSRPHRCPKCHLSFTGTSQLAEHLATHRDDNFPCDICDRTFSCKISRAEHRKIHTEQEDAPPSAPEKTEPSPPDSSSEVEDLKYRCSGCNEHFKDLSEHDCMTAREGSSEDVHAHSLESNKHSLHGPSSHPKKPSQPYIYTCNQCHMSFAYRRHFLSHLKRHGDSQATAQFLGGGIEAKAAGTAAKIYKCPICPHSFAQALELSTHLSVHSENTYECKTCKLTYPSKSKLAEHERCHMTAATQYECTECGKSFLGKDAFRQHHCSRRQRAGSDGECPLPSTSKSTKTSKQATEEEELDVGEDFFNCLDCSKRFFLKHDLLEHQKKYHPSKPLFTCKDCGKTFPLKRYLRDHERRQHKNQAPQKENDRLKCSHCPKSFDLPQDLQLHMRMHAEQEGGEHRCDMCYKSFSVLSRLRQHQETHVGQVVYECTECDKAFAFPHLLDEHQKSHVVPNI